MHHKSPRASKGKDYEAWRPISEIQQSNLENQGDDTYWEIQQSMYHCRDMIQNKIMAKNLENH